MKIWNGLERYPRERVAVVATLGNYDGVHVGHQAILQRVVEDARRSRLASLLLTFDPHPLVIVAPERRPERLQTRRQKLDALEQTGIGGVLILEFTAELATLSGEQFFARLGEAGLALAAVHVGQSFRFGRAREGDVARLRQIGDAQGFEVHVVPPVQCDGEIASSSIIRAAVAAGQVERARRLLGRPFELQGRVVRGDGRGRSLQCPTANLEVENEIHPANGVYISETVVLAARFASLTNVGTRPTFMGRERVVESHLLDYEGDLYDEPLAVRFLARVRDEMRFDSAWELADQIARDRAAAESYFQQLPLR